ncbi:LacI family DNA-binding transcriptional regulator [Roseovarius sp. 217]|uniref:LacI family DNA-binding transcriptional regulator n=1 Tax=Roseovarius sp. (strain 217) TaxID=314264 RepID=UPI0000687D82|nr:LacI family DNA-binding transcriptional regulator [Roseovarius sp. 217]EAQ24102.1 transcriptional regulator, LacI family protein [Roseovarius sp. 217]
MNRRVPDNALNLPTLADVARAAGVSTATVSRCLNSPSQVQESTRERVLAAVMALGYSPNFGARALAARRTGTIGAIIPTMENAIFARAIQAFQEELHLSGVTLLVASSSYSPQNEADQIRTLVARGADALLLIGHDRDPGIYAFLEQRGVPVLVSWAFDPAQARPAIGFDNRRAMAALAKEVLRLGHQRVGMISALAEGNDRARDRISGVRDALRDHGLDPTALHLIEIPYSIANGAEAMAKLMALPARPTAVICGNDVLAVGALQMARKLGLRVPADVSITGFDDIELATVVDPALTTVHVPHREMGREAARLLVAMVGGAGSPPPVCLETEFCPRGTLAAPSA